MSRRGCQRIRSVNLFLPSFFLPFSQDLLRLSGVVVGFFCNKEKGKSFIVSLSCQCHCRPVVIAVCLAGLVGSLAGCCGKLPQNRAVTKMNFMGEEKKKRERWERNKRRRRRRRKKGDKRRS